jgi:YVTN family beta-propeller protein
VGKWGVWALNLLDRTVSRIDPASNRVVATVHVDGRPTRVVEDDNAVWVSTTLLPTESFTSQVGVDRIDPESNTVQTLIPVAGTFRNELCAGAGAIWTATDTGVASRIDPVTNKVVAEIRLEKPAAGIAFGDGSVWVATLEYPGTVIRVDPTTNAVAASVPAGGVREFGFGNAGVDVGDGKVWVTNNVDDSVLAISTVSNQVLRRIGVQSVPTDLAIGAGALWVAIYPGATT